jgi:hypothetical protein
MNVPSLPSLIEGAGAAAVATTAAVEWKITLDGRDAFGEVRRHEILKSWDRLFDGEDHCSPSNRDCEPGGGRLHALRRICPGWGVLRPVKDHSTRRIRTAYGTAEVRNPLLDAVSELSPRLRSRLCAARRNLPRPGTRELTELTARLGSMIPDRQAASVMAEFLPIE